MKDVTVIWNIHGEGSLIGVFDDEGIISKIRDTAKGKHNEIYFKFIKVKVNDINKHDLKKYLDIDI